MILIGETSLSKRGNKLLLQKKVVPRAFRPFQDDCSWFFIFKEVICMDSDYYYYYSNECNLINYTNYLGGNKKWKKSYLIYFKKEDMSKI